MRNNIFVTDFIEFIGSYPGSNCFSYRGEGVGSDLSGSANFFDRFGGFGIGSSYLFGAVMEKVFWAFNIFRYRKLGADISGFLISQRGAFCKFFKAKSWLFIHTAILRVQVHVSDFQDSIAQLRGYRVRAQAGIAEGAQKMQIKLVKLHP